MPTTRSQAAGASSGNSDVDERLCHDDSEIEDLDTSNTDGD
jgi:hypothetical protein